MAGAAFALALLVFLLAMWPQVLDMSRSPLAVLAFGALWLALVSGCVCLALSVRTAFVFGVDGVASRQWWGTRAMAYADMAGCTVVHEEPAAGRGAAVGGYRVTFAAMRRGVRPLQLFVQDGRPLDAAILRRLKTVPGLSRRQLKILEVASSAHAQSERLSHAPERAGEA